MPTEKHVVTFTFDEGKAIYKSSCLNEIFKSKKLSKDRLRRVQCLSGFPGIDVSGNDSDAFLSTGDPVVHTSNERIIIANIKKMSKANVVINNLPLSLNNFEAMNTVIITIQKLKTK